MITTTEPHLYTCLSQISSAPKWSLKGKHIFKYGSVSPGPGYYDCSSVLRFKTRPGGSTMGAPRPNIAINPTPGPGQYKCELPCRTRSVVFGSAPRTISLGESRPSSPGPGSYQTTMQDPKPAGGSYLSQLLSSRPKSTVYPSSQRRLLRPVADVPGPGQYNTKQSFPSKSLKFGKSPRRLTLSTTGVPTPGPGAYSYHIDSFNHPHSFKFNSRRVSKYAGAGLGPLMIGPYTQFGP
jgi:Sperm-tail PG-rich repeat